MSRRKEQPAVEPEAAAVCAWADIEQEIADTIAERDRLQNEALPRLRRAFDAARDSRDAARTRREMVRGAALIDDDAAARGEHQRLGDELRKLDDLVAEHGSAIADAERRIERLDAKRVTLGQDRGRAQIAARSPEAIGLAEQIETGLQLVCAGWHGLRDVRIAQTQIGADCDLPDAEMAQLHNFRALSRRIRWVLGNLPRIGITRPESGRYLADVTAGQIERDLQSGAVPLDVVDDDEGEIVDLAETA